MKTVVAKRACARVDDGERGVAGGARVTRDVLLLTLAAFSVRLAWLRWGAWEAVDGADYLALAKNLAFYHVFSLDAQTLAPTAHRPPLYPALIALLWWGGGAPVYAVLLLQALLGTLTVSLVYLMARDRFSRPTALLAAAGMTLAPMTCLFTAALLTETLFTFLLMLGLFFWGRGNAVWAGVAFGLAILTRPALMPFLVALPLLSLLPAWRKHRPAHVLIFIVAMAVASVWIVRNALVFGRFVPVAASGWGTNLLCGTLETDTGGRVWDGTAWVPLNLDTHPLLKVEGTDEVQKDRIRMARAVSRIASAPWHWLVVRAKQYPKLLIDNGDYLLGSYNLSIREAIRAARPFVVLVKLIFILTNLLVFALAAYGIYCERARFVALEHVTLFPIFLLAVHLPLWIEPRYLIPAMPLVAILAAAGFMRTIKRNFDEP